MARRDIKKRTASMSGVTFDLNAGLELEIDAAEPPPQHHPFHRDMSLKKTTSDGTHQGLVAGSAGPLRDQWLLMRNLPPRDIISRTRSAPHFLQSCRLCMRRLVPGRDIYMYRGDSAFCSQECREQQMDQDERKEKCLMNKSKKAATSGTAVGSKAAATVGETVTTM